MLTMLPGASVLAAASICTSLEKIHGAPARARRPSLGFSVMVLWLVMAPVSMTAKAMTPGAEYGGQSGDQVRGHERQKPRGSEDILVGRGDRGGAAPLG